MNLQRLKELIKLSYSPAWVLRDPDQEQAPDPAAANPAQAPVPGQPVKQQQKPKAINQAAINRFADQMLLSKQPTNTEPVSSDNLSNLSTLSENLKNRYMSRRGNPAMPGRISSTQGMA